MFRFFEQLGRCNCCNPSTDVLTAADRQVLVTSGQDRHDPNTEIHGFYSFRNGTAHSKQGSKSVAPQDSSAAPIPQSLPCNSQAGVEQSVDATLQDPHHSVNSGNTRIVPINEQNVNSWGTVHINPELHSDQSTTRIARPVEFQSLPSNSQTVEQGICAILQDAHHFSIGGNARFVTIGQQNVNNRGTYGLDNLKEFVSFNALHDSSAQDPDRCCHPGTRRNVIDKMRTWMDDPSAPEQILWLHGPAGVGKSAIAQTVSHSYCRNKIGATFFFFRSDPVRNDGNRLVPTLAWQLASSVPIVKDLIAFSLEEYPDIPRKAIEVQFNQLIAQPFLTISGGNSTVPTLSRVIIIDGLDECSDEKLQERVLKIIGNFVADSRFPLRFVIISRPEAHIQDFFDQFQYPTLRIDLANVDDAFRDIKTYLTSEFDRIAVEQELDPKTWPTQGIIDALVSKSSGQFVYASTVMKYIGDKYESAVAQLNIILGLQPSTGRSPFSELDALYTEILKRQRDQNFLKEFLTVLVARSTKDGNLHNDDAMLLDVDEKQLHRKLRGMRSLLRFEPFIDVYHKSFLDFLDDSSRSGEYHVSKHFANMRYMQRITDLLVKAASSAMEQSDSHEGDHFNPRFATVTKKFPFSIELPLNVLEEILRPLQIIQENLLQMPNMSVPWKPRACSKCWTFHMIDDLLVHLSWLRGTIQLQEPKYVGIRPLTAMEEKQSIPPLDLDACLPLLLADLRGEKTQVSLNVDTIGLVRALVRFDPTETAMKIRSITDAQNLVELIFCLNKNECFKSWFGAAAHKATQLAVAIYGRVALLPRSLLLNKADINIPEEIYEGKAVKIWILTSSVQRDCFYAFMWGCLSHGNMGPLLGICSSESYPYGIAEVLILPEDASTLRKWRRIANPSVSKIQQIVLEVAKAIQYIHSLGIVFGYALDAEDDVYLDSDNHAKVQCAGFRPDDLCEEQLDYDIYYKDSMLETNICSFGLLFYRVLFNEFIFDDVSYDIRPEKPEIPDNVWQLIQWCCAKDPKQRPTMDQVVQEMESWISLGQFTLSS